MLAFQASFPCNLNIIIISLGKRHAIALPDHAFPFNFLTLVKSNF